MPHYLIISQAHADYGLWQGDSEAEALLALHHHHSSPQDVWMGESGWQLEFADEDARSRLGDVGDWHIREVEVSVAAVVAECVEGMADNARVNGVGYAGWKAREAVETYARHQFAALTGAEQGEALRRVGAWIEKRVAEEGSAVA